MADVLFAITCTTCEARLNVRDASAIGQIVTCPKCGSMVQVVPPPDWQAPTQSAQPAKSEQPKQPPKPKQSPPTPQPTRPAPEPKGSVPKVRKPTPPPSEPPARKTEDAALDQVASPASKAQHPEESDAPKPRKSPAKVAATAAGASAAAATLPTEASEAPTPVPEPPEPSFAEGLSDLEAPPIQSTVAPLPPEAGGTPPTPAWTSPAEAALRRWLWWGAAPAAGIVLVVGALVMFSGKEPAPQPPTDPKTPSVSENDPSLPPALPLPDDNDRWLPDSPEFVLNLEIADCNAAGQLAPLLKTSPPLQQAIVQELFQGFGLNAEAVERLSWSSPDLSNWSDTAVVVIVLAQGQSTQKLRSAGTTLDWQVDNLEFRQLGRPSWDRAFTVLDDRTIVTGEGGLLRQVAERADRQADLGLLQPLLTAAPAEADFFLALDLQAVSAAGWPMPTEWFDVWPQGRDAWRLIWKLPSALSFSFDREDLALAELGLLCDGDTVADKVRVALEQWLPQAKSVLSARVAGLPASVQSGEIPPELAKPYRQSLEGGVAALASTSLEVAHRCVWVRADCGRNGAAWTVALASSMVAMQADWYRAARNVDETLQGNLQKALSGYEQAEQKAPPGAINSGPLPPEKVLSWFTAILPQLGHESWAQDLNTSYSWDSPKNRSVTMRPLEAVQNPAVAVRATPSGFPVTHYVGVAGIGPDAADLPRSDPRAGIFGYRESRRLTDIPDGASNTIATVGVSDQLGSWASGGRATVRGFTQTPYINGPDGFGSGQPGGMVVGMADGSARFLSANTDPTVLEQLATAAGGEAVTLPGPASNDVARVEPQPSPPKETEPENESTPTQPDQPSGEPQETDGTDLLVRLQTPLPGIAIAGAPLNQTVRSIEDYAAFSVTFDVDTMSALGIPLNKPVNLRVTETTLGQALDAVLASCGLKPLLRDNGVWVTGAGQATDTPRPVKYSVADLTASGKTPGTELAKWIPQMIAPETWKENGGIGTIQVKGDSLEVTQTDAVHLQILDFCERLRVARGLAPRSGQPAARFTLVPRRVRAAACLDQPVSVNFFRPTPLRRVLTELEQTSETQISVNWLALENEGKKPTLPAVLTVAQIPLEQALAQMLEPLGLTYRAVDARTIEVTTRAAADSHFEREFYRIGDLLDAGKKAPNLIAHLRQVGKGSWNSEGGKGFVQFDEPSRCLIVFQTQSSQAEIARLLDAMRSELKAAASPQK